jgi:hypothetical protein
MALSAFPSKASGAVPMMRSWFCRAIEGSGAGGGGGGWFPGRGYAAGVGQWGKGTVGEGFTVLLVGDHWGTGRPLEVGGVCVYIDWDGPAVCRGLGNLSVLVLRGSGVVCFPLDMGGVGTWLVSGDGRLKLPSNGVDVVWGVLG